MKKYCKKMAKQQVNKIHVLTNHMILQKKNAKIEFLKV